MMRIASAIVLLAGLGACEMEIGEAGTSPQFGAATAVNLAAQHAFVAGDAALRDLSQDFRASTTDVVTFAFDEVMLDAAARNALDGQARWLRAHPEVRMTIVGHTDLVGGERYNHGLGLRRAESVLAYLVGKGVARNRLIAVESRGETEPVVPTTTRERQNRRAATMVAGYARDHAGTGLDGEYAQRIYDAYQAGELRVTDAASEIPE